MADDLQRELTGLRAIRSLNEDLYQQGLSLLRAKYGDGPVDLALQIADQPIKPASSQDIGDNANIGVNVVGSVFGHVFLNGYRERSREELLAAYLGRLAERCAAMPLQGVNSERDTDDTLSLGLDQVYTQLATSARMPREVFAGAALQAFDPEAFLQEHIGAAVQPKQRRVALYIRRPRTAEDGQTDQLGRSLAALGETVELLTEDGKSRRITHTLTERTSADELRRMIDGAQELTALGPQLISEAIAAERCLVLLGEPGGGKSTALRYLARNLARAGIEQGYDPAQQIDGWAELGRLLPIFAPLLPLARQLAANPARQSNDADLWNYLVDQLQPKGTYDGLAEAVMQEIDAGHVILLLDGLDEVASPESRRQVVQAVRAFAEQHKRCRIVVSCRTRAYDRQINPDNRRWQLPGWPTATLADLIPAQMEHFVEAWYGAVAAADPVIAAQCDERVEELQTALRARPDLRTLGARPLLLTIMALVHLRQRNLPEDRASLYRECVEILLARWELRGKEETEYKALMDYIGLPGVEVKALRPLLAKAAFAAHQASGPANPGLLSSDALQLMVQQFLYEKGHPDAYSGALRFLEYTDYRAGLIQAGAARSDYQFAHLTFQEYLAGLALVGDEQPVQAMLSKRADERWRLSIFLGIGHAVSEGLPSLFRDLLDELIADPASVRGQRDLILAAELAEDVRWERLKGVGFAKIKRELVQLLAAVVEGSTLPAAERVQAGALLGRLGDPRPGVCSLPPPMIAFTGGSFVIGSTLAEAQEAGEWYVEYFLQQGDKNTAEQARKWTENEINQQVTTVGPFALARYPVTNAQYALFIADSGYNPAADWWDAMGKEWLTSPDRYGRRDKHAPELWADPRFGVACPNAPVVGVTSYEAVAFCRWLSQHATYNPQGYRYYLPSEAEWEYAARGSERRMFAWGTARPDGERANCDETYSGTSAVGCFPTGASPEGLDDMAGNVWEWTRSAFALYDATDRREEAREPQEKSFTLRGGSWPNPPAYLRASFRDEEPPEYGYFDLGFRLARHLKL